VNVVDQSPLDGTSLILDTVRHPREERVEAAARLVLERASIRAPNVEAMASGDHQVIDAHQLLHDRPVTTVTTQTVQRLASARTASRMLAEMTASPGRSTIGVSVPS
jgi:hypothetical protein